MIIYPMNALASDQAKRIAELIDGSEELKTAGIRVGMYVGGQEHSSVKMMLFLEKGSPSVSIVERFRCRGKNLSTPVFARW